MAKRHPEDEVLPVSSFDVDEEDPFYKVGYKKPPLNTRFQKGNNAAAKRRKKPASLTTDLLKILDEKVEVMIKGKTCKMTHRELIARRTVQDALSGKPSAIRSTRLLMTIGNESEPIIPDHKIRIEFIPPMELDDPRRTKLIENSKDGLDSE